VKGFDRLTPLLKSTAETVCVILQGIMISGETPMDALAEETRLAALQRMKDRALSHLCAA